MMTSRGQNEYVGIPAFVSRVFCHSGMESGELDAVIGARAPSCFLRGAPGVGRLFFRRSES